MGKIESKPIIDDDNSTHNCKLGTLEIKDMSGDDVLTEKIVAQDVPDATSEIMQGEKLRIKAIGPCTWEVYNEDGVDKKEISPGEDITIDFKPTSLKRTCVNRTD